MAESFGEKHVGQSIQFSGCYLPRVEFEQHPNYPAVRRIVKQGKVVRSYD